MPRSPASSAACEEQGFCHCILSTTQPLLSRPGAGPHITAAVGGMKWVSGAGRVVGRAWPLLTVSCLLEGTEALLLATFAAGRCHELS